MSKTEKKLADAGSVMEGITETNTSAADRQEKAPKKPMDKKRKKKIIRRCIIGGILVVIVLFMVRNSIAAQNMGIMVSTMPVTIENVEQNLSTSGTVKSEEAKTYFAPVAVKVGKVEVAAGDSVEKGQSLLQYDADALAEAKQMSELKQQANEGGYVSSVYKNNKYVSQLGEANVNLSVLNQQIEDSENYEIGRAHV